MKRLALIVALAALASCTGDVPDRKDSMPAPPTPAAVGTVAPEKATFHLTVTNQSFIDSRAGLDIAIDGRRVIDAAFEVGGQHNFYGYAFALEPGEHVLTATGPGATRTRQLFSLPAEGVRYGVLQYWHYEDEGRRFTWTFQPSAPVFG